MIKLFDNLKNIYPDKIILLRIDNYYEPYREDAKRASGILHINALTRIVNDEDISVIRFHMQDLGKNLEKLVRGGLKVAVYDEKL